MANKLDDKKEKDLMHILERANEPLPEAEPASIPKNQSQTWHIRAESSKGCFQWIVDADGNIIDCPYFLRGYWIGRQVDMVRLLEHKPPVIFVRCQTTGHVDEIKTSALEVYECHLTTIPDYDYNEPYTGGLYDIRSG